MKNFGKLMAAILVIAAIMMTMCVPAMAATPAEGDSATVKITNLTAKEGLTVKLYHIVKAKYDTTGFAGYESAIPTDKQGDYSLGNADGDVAGMEFAQVSKIWAAVKTGTLTLTDTVDMTVKGTEATADVTAGTWLAVVTGGGDTIYNPIVVSAMYKTENGQTSLKAGDPVDVQQKSTLNGGTAVAKSSKPKIDKTVTGGTTADASDGTERKTVSVGDAVSFELKPDLPSYPANATNKTFYVKDTMSAGLTLDASSIKVDGLAADNSGKFTKDGKELGTLFVDKANPNSFKVVFNYDNLTAAPVVTYSAVVNDNAVVGKDGNTNTATLVYSNDPTKGTTWDPGTPDQPKPEPEPGEDSGITKTEDTETVYTYQLAFKKTGTGDEEDKLQGAQFGIYSDKECTKLVDIVTTNTEGYAVSSKVGAGTYYIKELKAPEGYSLNGQTYEIQAQMKTATSTATVTKREYTTMQADGAVQVGWLKGTGDAAVFYAMNNKPNGADVQAAYLKSETTTTGSVTEQGTGAGTVLLGTPIPNTKVSELPSTGGMGTTLFVVGGIAVMALAIVLIAANKRRTSESK